MAETVGIDFSGSKPAPQAVRSAGYSFVLGYISHDVNKDLSPAQILNYRAAGLEVYLVFETTASRALAGRAAGVSDAQYAASVAKSRGYPDHLPIFFADDTDSTADQVRPYFQGVRSVLGDRTGGYGGKKVTEPLAADGTITWVWQSAAWSIPPTIQQGASGADVARLQGLLHITVDGSFGPATDAAVRAYQASMGLTVDGVVGSQTWDAIGGAIYPSAHLYQRLHPQHKATFGDYDENLLLKPLPLWVPAKMQTPVQGRPSLPSPAKGYSMLAFAQGRDVALLNILGELQVGVGTSSITEAKAAIARGDKVIVLGGPATAALNLTWATTAGRHTQGNITVLNGATGVDTAKLTIAELAS